MVDSVEQENNKISASTRQRKAAYKAWRTIRQNKRFSASKRSKTILEFVKPETVTSLQHPEIISPKKMEEVTSFGKNIVSLFHKTPEDIACGRFWELRWAFGCPLDCNYCYLRGTMRGRMKPSPIDPKYIMPALDEAFENIKEPSIFNSGELSDSLMLPSLMEKIADKFETQKKHKLATLSKFGPRNVEFLIKKPRKQVICAWSINAEVARLWEKAAPPLSERIMTAKMVSDAGYDTRIRVDPIFPVESWQSHYQELLYKLLSEFEPKRIILGTPRGLWKTIKYANKAGIDMSWTRYFKEDSGWGKKLSFNQRKEIYQFFYDKLNSLGYNLTKVSMCKETVDMWKELGRPYTPLTCNCYGPKAYLA